MNEENYVSTLVECSGCGCLIDEGDAFCNNCHDDINTVKLDQRPQLVSESGWYDTYGNSVESLHAHFKSPVTVLTDDAAVITVTETCHRCGGEGGWKGWPGYTCYRCGGGRYEHPRNIKLYSETKQAKLEASRIKRAETKRLKAVAKEDAFWKNINDTDPEFYDAIQKHRGDSYFIENVCTSMMKYWSYTQPQREAIIKVGKQIDAKAAAESLKTNGYIGHIGERESFEATVTFRSSYVTESYSGYGTETVYITILEDDEGRCIKHSGSGKLSNVPKGDKVSFSAMIKDHSEYNDKKQTVINRPTKIKEV